VKKESSDKKSIPLKKVDVPKMNTDHVEKIKLPLDKQSKNVPTMFKQEKVKHQDEKVKNQEQSTVHVNSAPVQHARPKPVATINKSLIKRAKSLEHSQEPVSVRPITKQLDKLVKKAMPEIVHYKKKEAKAKVADLEKQLNDLIKREKSREQDKASN
jgi:hypothetical protein